jgi:hypothetical protein
MLGGMGKSGTLEYVGLAREIPQSISSVSWAEFGAKFLVCILLKSLGSEGDECRML